MSLNNKIKQQGFTIVELLIVIVVIGILAAITIVAYNGVQNRAKTSAGQSLAGQIAKKAEAWNTIKSAYPTLTELTTGATDAPEAKLDNASSIQATDVNGTSAAGGKVVTYQKCATSGAVVKYWDYAASPAAAVTQNIGTVAGACS